MSMLTLRRAGTALGLVLAAGLLWHGFAHAAEKQVEAPVPTLDPASTAESATVVFSGGCFWGVQGVFQHVKGVTSAVSGYAGGKTNNPSYEEVSTGETGHAESVRITYDPRQVSYGTLLRVFFSVTANPTELNYQGPDEGTQYRTDIFTMTPDQEKVTKAYIAQLEAAHVYKAKIVTRVDPYANFFPAEGYHQDYLTLHPDQPYIAFNDIPKVEGLKTMFPDLYRDKPVLVGGSPKA